MAGVNFLPIQAGTGDPSPTNVRPITPGLSITGIGDIYGGYLDVANGTVVEEWVKLVVDGSASITAVYYHQNTGLYYINILNGLNSYNTTSSMPHLYSDKFKTYNTVASNNCYITANGMTLIAVLSDQTATTKELAMTWFENNPTTFVYELATPITHPLTTAQLTEAMQKLKVPSAPAQALHRRLANTPHPVSTTPASIASFDTDMVGKLKSAKFAFSPVQSGSGDPSPTNVRAISGWDGVTVERAGMNLLDKSNTMNAVIRATTNTIEFNSNWKICYAPCKPNTVYTIQKMLSERFIVGYIVTAELLGANVYNKKIVNTSTSTSITTGDNATFLVCSYYSSDYDTESPETILDSIQIELGSTATTYTPYTGSTYPVTWQSAGTIYGGYVDVAKGVVVAEWGAYTITGNEILGSTGPGQHIIQKPSIALMGGITPSSSDALSDALCTFAVQKTYNALNVAGDTDGFGFGSIGFVILGSKQYDSWSNLVGEKIVFKLATPITYTLTPQIIKSLKGTNNLWSNANGDTTITYWAH